MEQKNNVETDHEFRHKTGINNDKGFFNYYYSFIVFIFVVSLFIFSFFIVSTCWSKSSINKWEKEKKKKFNYNIPSKLNSLIIFYIFPFCLKICCSSIIFIFKIKTLINLASRKRVYVLFLVISRLQNLRKILSFSSVCGESPSELIECVNRLPIFM